MRRVHVLAELSEETFRAYAGEARRRGVEVEILVQQTVNELLRELETEERDGTDHPITPA